jgi:YggT family protein
MFLFGNFFSAVAVVTDAILQAYMWIIIVSALISWVNPDPYNPVVRFLHAATEPVLRPIRRKLGIYGGFDFSPMIVILAIYFLRAFLVASLFDMGRGMH